MTIQHGNMIDLLRFMLPGRREKIVVKCYRQGLIRKINADIKIIVLTVCVCV